VNTQVNTLYVALNANFVYLCEHWSIYQP